MAAWVDAILVFAVLTNLAVLGSSRLGLCIRMVAAQGIMIGLLPVVGHWHAVDARAVGLATASVLLKGFLVPWLLHWALVEANVRREVEPYIGYPMSVLIGVASLCLCLWLSARMPLPVAAGEAGTGASALAAPVAFFSILCGLLMIVSRRKALTQVLGYLVMENGIFTFGVALALEEPFLVEFGVLLDVVGAVFVMGVAVFHISREIHSIDTDQLSMLREERR
ncbi:MAG: hydrogenase [Planctomycetes bacterium]|nr:hydrogenase [Planctomycetota bacterium]